MKLFFLISPFFWTWFLYFVILTKYFVFLDANKFKEAFEEAQHILEQNQNSDEEKDDGVGSEDDTESNSEESEDEREDSKAADAEQNKVDAAIIDKLEELKVSDQVPSTNKEEK